MATTKQFDEIGRAGLPTFGGRIDDEFVRELRGDAGYKRYDEMRRNSAVVGALLTAIELMIRNVRWNVESDQGNEDPRVQLVSDSLDAMTRSWNDHVSEALTMLPFGWSLFEIVYQRDGARILWRKLAIRGQDTLSKWEFDDTGSIKAFVQSTSDNGYKPVTIPIEKCLLYRTRVERNNPEGRSILRNAWVSYYFLKNIQQVEAIGVERDLAGMPVITLPPGADTSDSNTSDLGVARKMVRNIRRDEQEGIVLPSDQWKLELLNSAGSRQFDTNAIIMRYESRILMSALSQFLILGQNNVGTQALSKDMSALFDITVNSVADNLAETFSKYAIPRLLELNGMEPNGIRLVHTPVGEMSLQELGAFLTSVSGFLTWTPQDELWLRDVARLPEINEDTIEMERERKASIAAQIRGQVQQPAPDDDEDEDEGDQMGAEYYAVKPEADMVKWERRYTDLWQGFLQGQQRRVMTGARSIKRGNA